MAQASPSFLCLPKERKQRKGPLQTQSISLSLLAKIPKLAPLKRMGFFTVHFVKNFAQFMERGAFFVLSLRFATAKFFVWLLFLGK